MKILAIGDFHGEFPSKFNRLIKKEKIDLIVSTGDYFPFSYREIWFKHCYDQDKELWEIIGKKKYKELVLKDLKQGEKIIKKLNSLDVPVITTHGNIDYTRIYADNEDIISTKTWKWDNQNFFEKIMKKYPKVKRFDYSFFKFKDFIFIGTYGSTNKGNQKSRTYKRNKKRMQKIFDKFKNQKNQIIFVGHNVPYNTKLDKAGNKSHPRVRGKHLGSRMISTLIREHKPLLYIGGHMHTNQGKDKIKKTILINPGAAKEGKAAIIEIDDFKENIKKIKFIKN
jgi:Icc-related predicted phosphoesterase